MIGAIRTETITVITSEKAAQIVNDYISRAESKTTTVFPSEYVGLFLAKGKDGAWIAIDNLDGNCWVEEFAYESIARDWLIGTKNAERNEQ